MNQNIETGHEAILRGVAIPICEEGYNFQFQV